MTSQGKRKLKLQVQMTVNGFIGGPNGELDWMSFNWEDLKLLNYINDLTDSVDAILLGRKMTEGFISYWTDIVNKPDDPQYPFARKMVDKPKVVFTKTLEKSNWENTKIAKGDLVEEINKLKKSPSSAGGQPKDIIVYGGASFVSSLIRHNLIDEYNFFIHPTAIGIGISIFGLLTDKRNLKLSKSIAFDCGIVLNCYVPNI
jgi:dihydrofolate reductase